MTSIKQAFKDLPKRTIYNHLVANSRCRVICPNPIAAELLTLQIEFTGELMQMPSANDKFIFMAGRRPILGWHKEAQARLDAMKTLFTKAVMDLGILPPTFHDAFVHVQTILGHSKGRWDCHNTTKAVCDWLEDVGVIKDDARAQAWTSKAAWFELPQDRTTIIITRLQWVSGAIRRFNQDLLAPEG